MSAAAHQAGRAGAGSAVLAPGARPADRLLAPLVRPLARAVSADALSWARAGLAAPMLAALALGWPAPVGLGIYAAAWLTDVLDGAVARERARRGRGADADRGELIDTVADKVLLLAVIAALLARAADAWGAAVLLAAAAGELYLLGRRLADYRRGRRAYPPFALGRPKVWLQVIALGALAAAALGAGSAWRTAGELALTAALPLTAWSIYAKREPRAARS